MMLFYQKCNYSLIQIASRMIAEAGYIQDQFSKHFLEVKKRKLLPIINRGTWARVFSVISVIENFLKKYPEGQIISLGCGYDTTYFTLKEKYPQKGFKYFQMDFPQIIEKKVQLKLLIKLIQQISKIGKSKKMVQLIKAQQTEAKQQQNQQVKKQKLYQSLNKQSYFIIGEDLRNINQQNLKLWNIQSEQAVQKCQQSSNRMPTIVISQVVFIYMSHEQTENIIAQLTSYIKGPIIFTTYQMINPNDPFGKMMVGNLEDRGCPLRGISDCPDQASQEKRYKTVGKCDRVFVENMLNVYNNFLDAERRKEVQKIQFFDEFQEWNMLQNHYCLVIGVKNRNDEEDISNQIFLKLQQKIYEIGEADYAQQELLKKKLQQAKLMKYNKFID